MLELLLNVGEMSVMPVTHLIGAMLLRRQKESNECYRQCLLKNSSLLENSENSGDTKCLEIREDRLYRILTQFHFCDFCRNEFFNRHASSRQLKGL
jgi:hypothetical protein